MAPSKQHGGQQTMQQQQQQQQQQQPRRQRQQQRQQPKSPAKKWQGMGEQFAGYEADQNIKPSQINQKVIATAETGDPLALLSVVSWHVQRMNLVNLSTSIHRLAKCVDRDPQALAKVVGSRAYQELHDMIRYTLGEAPDKSCLHQSLSNIAWSLARLSGTDAELLALMVSISTTHLDGFKPFELSTLLWAFAKLGAAEAVPGELSRLFQAACELMVGNLHHFSFRSLATTAWAFATARQRAPRLFAGMAEEMRRTVVSANCQEISNTAWAFASVGHRDRRLLAALAKAALPLMPGFKAQEISNLLWGFASIGFWSEEVFAHGVMAALQMDLGSQHLANILWACTKVMPKQKAALVCARFAPLCTKKLATYKPQEIASTVRALAKALLPEGAAAPTQAEKAASCEAAAPLHPDVVVLLESLAQWVALSAPLLTASFAHVVRSLVLLGERAQRRLDFFLERAVAERSSYLQASEQVQLLEAFLRVPDAAQFATAKLAASLLRAWDRLQPQEFQALAQLRGGACGGYGSEEALRSWCVVLACSTPSTAPSAESESHKGQEACERTPSEVSDDFCLPSVGAYLDPNKFGSEFRVKTDDSLPFLEWRPDSEVGEGAEHKGQEHIAGLLRAAVYQD